MDIVRKLANLLSQFPSTIEILPGQNLDWLGVQQAESSPFLYVDGNLGIPEKILYSSYILSIGALKKVKTNLDVPDNAADTNAAIASYTSIILLANPGHQTALNMRKKLVVSGYLSPRDELEFTRSLLSLKQCSKVSILWHHRRMMLFCLLSENGLTDEQFVTIPLGIDQLKKEFSIALSACVTYPRNYFAWNHRSLCMLCCASQARTSPAHAELLKEEKKNMKDWINAHISDHSAMYYICRLFDILRSQADQSTRQQLINEQNEHVLELLQRYPSHESLWLYLRRSVLSSGFGIPGQNLGHLDKDIQMVIETAIPNDKILEATHTVQHALVFLAWANKTLGKRMFNGSEMRKIASASASERVRLLKDLRQDLSM